jgi:predicted DNA binding CopG/RHH family protein
MTKQKAKDRPERPNRRATAGPRKAIPLFQSEAEERVFWESHDSTDYVDWTHAAAVRLPNLKPSTQTISLRLPLALLERIKVEANKRDMPYQSLIKAWLAERVDRPRA